MSGRGPLAGGTRTEGPKVEKNRYPTSCVEKLTPVGAGPKKVGGPAPQIGLVRNTVAQVPTKKSDLRHHRFSDGIVRGPSVLSRRGKGQRSSKTLSDGIVRGPSVLSRRGKGQRSSKTPSDGIVRGPSVLSRRGEGVKKQQNAQRRDCEGPQRPFAEGEGAKKQQNAQRRDCERP